MSAPNDIPVSNASGKNHCLGANITICSADDAALLFHRIAFGLEPTTLSGPSSGSAANQNYSAIPLPYSSSPSTSHPNDVAIDLPASLFFTPVNSTPINPKNVPAEGDDKPWTDADDETLCALLIEANRGMTVGEGEAEASTSTSVLDLVQQYWLFSQCRTAQGRETVWIKTESVNWEKVALEYFNKYGGKLHPHHLKAYVDNTFNMLGIKPSSNATATSQAEASAPKAVRKRRSMFMNKDDSKRIRNAAPRMSTSGSGAVWDLTVKESLNRAPVARMKIDEPEMVAHDGGPYGLEEGIFREDGRTDDELDSAEGLLRLSACNSSHEQWATEVLLELGKSLRWSLPRQPNGETQMEHPKVFTMVVAGHMGNIGSLKPVYTQKVRAYMSRMSSDGAAARNGMVLPDTIEDIVATLRDAPFENRTIIVCDSDRCSLFASLLLEKIHKGVCAPGTSTWPMPGARLFSLLEELVRRVKGGKEIKFGGIVKGSRVMASPFSFRELGAIDFETFKVVVQAASD